MLVLLSVFAGTSALQAHRFEVAILQSPKTNPDNAQQFINGFMLATTERDAHQDEESDGHLGGLDVYVTMFEATPIADLAARGIDIIVLNSATAFRGMVGSAPGDTNVPIILFPGATPFEQIPDAPGVRAFVATFQRTYGLPATSSAADGYNAARRIDLAVRLQGGVADDLALQTSFDVTAHSFNW